MHLNFLVFLHFMRVFHSSLPPVSLYWTKFSFMFLNADIWPILFKDILEFLLFVPIIEYCRVSLIPGSIHSVYWHE